MASGWLAGLTDPVVAPALQAMHARPAHSWTVAQLAPGRRGVPVDPRRPLQAHRGTEPA